MVVSTALMEALGVIKVARPIEIIYSIAVVDPATIWGENAPINKQLNEQIKNLREDWSW